MWGFTDDFARSFGLLEDFRRRLDRAFDDVSGADWSASAAWPRASLEDTGSELVLVAEVPGLESKDLEITGSRDTLTVAGRRDTSLPDGAALHRQERGQMSFARSFALPVHVDPDRVSADLKDGLLTITLPKAAEARPRQISVQAS
jgi:HSP20 family protein